MNRINQGLFDRLKMTQIIYILINKAEIINFSQSREFFFFEKLKKSVFFEKIFFQFLSEFQFDVIMFLLCNHSSCQNFIQTFPQECVNLQKKNDFSAKNNGKNI